MIGKIKSKHITTDDDLNYANSYTMHNTTRNLEQHPKDKEKLKPNKFLTFKQEQVSECNQRS